MSYVKTVWIDRNVQFPTRYTDELGNVKTFTPNAGTVYEAGTTVTALRMNNIEDNLESALNPTYSSEATTTQPVTSLPSTVINSQFNKAELRGRTVVPVVTDDTESITGWDTATALPSLNDSGTLFRGKSIKLTLTADGIQYSGNTQKYPNGISGKKYLISAYIKKGNGIDARLWTTVGGVQVVTNTTTNWVRVGLVGVSDGQPLYWQGGVNGVTGQYADIGRVMIVELATSEEGLSVSDLLAMYPWHNNYKSTDNSIIKSILEEPYSETKAIVPYKLKSVSDSIYDKYNLLTGQLTKNIEDKILTGAEISDLFIGTNVDAVRFLLTEFTNGIGIGQALSGWVKVVSPNMIEQTDAFNWDDAGSNAKFGTVQGSTYFWLFVTKGTFADLGAAQTYYNSNPVTIYYQLANPITTYNRESILSAEPNGTIIQSPFVWDCDFYSDKINITDINYPINTLDYVNKVNVDTGGHKEVHFYVNPIYFFSSNRIPLNLYLIFRKELDKVLPSWVKAKYAENR